MTADPISNQSGDHPPSAQAEPIAAPTPQQAARMQREADALRENLRRRKQQSRARKPPEPDPKT